MFGVQLLFLFVLIQAILKCSYLFKKNGLNHIFSNYFYILCFFFLFRTFSLVFSLDTLFPEHIIRWEVSPKNYTFGLLGFSTWITVFFLLIYKKKQVGEQELSSRVFYREKTALKLTIYFTFVLSILYFALALNGAGSLSRLIYFVRIDSEFKFGFMSTFPAITLMLTCVYLSSIKREFFMIAIALVLVLVHVATGDRSGIIFAFFIYAVVSYRKGAITATKLAILVPFGLFIASALKTLRNTFQLNIVSVQEDNIWRSIASGLNLNVFDAYYVCMTYVENGIALRYGYDFILGFIGLIPRFIWAQKPEIINTGVIFAQTFTDLRMGTPISSLGEWYWNFGVLGFIFGAFVTFLFLKLLQKMIRPFPIAAYGLSLILLLQIVQTGFTNVTMRELFLFAVLIFIPLFVFRFVRVRF